ncbi:MAG TPA: DUF2147 domain-containing protein [Burkholderiaceae bacterium]|nr:DUF2147 domain-containing protein [Burkholderiaceae bacterium]
MRTLLRSAALGAMLAGLAVAAHAQPTDSPAGLWKNIDDQTKQPKALIRIAEQNGVLTGRIERILTDRPDAVCDQCTDERKGKPIQGMTILSGLKKDGEEWTGGEILDPSNGKTYRARVKLADGGRKLDVRGYVGTPMLGRTQTWVREN